jgi:hypothetical protein
MAPGWDRKARWRFIDFHEYWAFLMELVGGSQCSLWDSQTRSET